MTGPRRGGLLLGIDAGQTASKAALYDLDGHEVATAAVPVVASTPRPRWVERDMDRAWSDLADVVRQVLAAAGPDAQVLAVGVAGHGDGLYPVDEALRPIRPAILATDTRAFAQAQAAATGEPGRRALALTGQVPFAAAPAALLSWLRDCEPEVFAALRWTLFCKDWIRLQLTGAVATDPSEASASFTRVHDQSYSREALEHYGLQGIEPALPPITGSADVAGSVTPAAAQLTGIPAGTPVVTGAHDVDAAALGIGAIHAGSASVVFGTFSINQVVSDRPITDLRWQARSFVRPGQWMHMSTSPAGAANLEWVLRQVGPLAADGSPDPGAGVVEAMSAGGSAGGSAGASAGGSADGDVPLFLPFLFGSPHGPDLAGAWVGMRGWHTRADLLRSVLEGVVFNHRTHLDALQDAFPLQVPVRVCGGGARSPDWTQLLSDATGLPVETTDAAEAGARGAALLAGTGIGAYADLGSAVARTVRVLRRQQPRPDAAARLTRRYRRYHAVVSALAAAENPNRTPDEETP